ncbi:MAG: D-lyxose/D-mannose family sugar isomerase [Planctomycetaceae bacterium]|nr:D-lyxose/D-mannose family sugar isomerase [Planctomycetaceae bacterium]
MTQKPKSAVGAQKNKGVYVSITGRAASAAMAAFRRQMKAWKVALPAAAEPLIIDFGLGEFDKTGLIEVWIANEVEAGYCGKYLFLFDGQTCPMHCHKMKHETFFVAQGKVRMTVGARTRIMKAGDVLAMPPGPRYRHRFTGLGSALLLEVSKPSLAGDNYFDDPRIAGGRK